MALVGLSSKGSSGDIFYLEIHLRRRFLVWVVRYQKNWEIARFQDGNMIWGNQLRARLPEETVIWGKDLTRVTFQSG